MIRSQGRQKDVSPTRQVSVISGTPRNQVDVSMHHRLTGHPPAVDCDVESSDLRILPEYHGARLDEQFLTGHHFRSFELKPVCHMSLGNNQQMPFRDRMDILDGDRKLVLKQYHSLVDRAEWTSRL